MIDDKYLTLLHGELDGVNSPQESAKLNAYLAAHPEAQRLLAELRGMSNLLGEVKPVEPPAHLQHAVMNTIAQRRAARAADQGRFTTFKNWLSEIFEPKFAFSFAGGLAVGVLLFALALQTMKDKVNENAKLFGTIGAPQTEEREQSRTIAHEIARGEIKWRHEEDQLVAEIDLAATEPFDLVVLFEASALRCKEVAVIDGEELPNTVLQQGRLQLLHAGERSYRIVFQSNQSTGAGARVQFQRNGAAFLDEVISFEKH